MIHPVRTLLYELFIEPLVQFWQILPVRRVPAPATAGPLSLDRSNRRAAESLGIDKRGEPYGFR